jgi:glucan phosphoethanolaminetransferase (alkaline phosphatase superfamily)
MNFKTFLPDRKDFFWVFLLSVIVLIPNIFLACYGSDFAGAPILKPCVYLGFSGLLFFIPALFLKARAFFIVQGIFVLLAPLEIAHVFLNKMTVTQSFLLSIIDTSRDESSELITSLKVPVFCYLLLCCLYFFVVFKKIHNSWLIRSGRLRIYAAGIFAVALFAGYIFHFTRAYSIVSHKTDVTRLANENFIKKFYKTYPYDIILKTYEVYSIKKQLKEGREKLKDFIFHAEKENPVAGKEVYVFVIGETGRYSSYSLNGYGRETSPLLSQTAHLISYTDFLSEANITASSLALILTRATARDYNRSYEEKSFVDAFREAGFKTYWIANQSAGNNFVRRIAEDTDGDYFTTTDFDAAGNYDEKLWVFLDKILAANDEKALIVIHTLGSHFRYNFRYPPSFEVFKPSLQGAFDYALISSKNKQQFINTYDNSILYTDFFLAHTIQKIDSLQAISALVYVADHGENLFDTDENMVLHGGSHYTEYDFHVPFFVWTSDQYHFQYPSKTEQLNKHKDKKLSAGTIFYSLLDIAGITFPGQVLEKSIASESLQEDSVRYIINTNMEVREE